MDEKLKDNVAKWYKRSPRRAVPIKVLWRQYEQEEGEKISYDYFLKLTKRYTKVQKIKTGGYYVNFKHFAFMTVSRSLNHVGMMNTISIDEKPFIPKKYAVKELRVDMSFHGKGTAKFFNAPDPLKNIKPHYLLCAISCQKVLLYHISDSPINSSTFNTFLWSLSGQFSTENPSKCFFLYDNASFHSTCPVTEKHLKDRNIFITHTATLCCFSNPIEEFFSLVHNYFIHLLSLRMLNNDSNLSNEEYVELIKYAINIANEKCNYQMIFCRAGLL